MKTKFALARIILGIILTAVTFCSFAGTPTWTFTPLTPTRVQVFSNTVVPIEYRITNQSKSPHTLAMRPIPGITQVTTGSRTCKQPFRLAREGDSCVLRLLVNGSVVSSINTGPIVCQQNSSMCYQPSPGDNLSINSSSASGYTVGGEVFGLAGTLQLQLNGVETISLRSDGPFNFLAIANGSAYRVTVISAPSGQTCSVYNGIGVINGANVNNVVVTCSNLAFPVGGTIQYNLSSGSPEPVTLVLNGMNPITLSANGPPFTFTFTFPTPIANGSAYLVTVANQPPNQLCSVFQAAGTISGSDVTNVKVTCSDTSYTVGGTVRDLVGTLVLTNNDINPTTITSNDPYTFSIRVANGSQYEVVATMYPATQICSIFNFSGTVSNAKVSNVNVFCAAVVPTTLSVPATGIIPVGVGVLTLPVTNTGTGTALNVRAILPTQWANVKQDAPECAFLEPGASCNITFATTEPHIARSITVTGGNVISPPAVALAFSVKGYLVFGIDRSQNLATVLDSSDLPRSAQTWIWDYAILNSAISPTDGQSNTYVIVNNTPTSYEAAYGCRQHAGPGLWYSPAICQMGDINQPANCAPGTPNIYRNLVQFGFPTINPLSNAPYWSSTQDGLQSYPSVCQIVPSDPSCHPLAWQQCFTSSCSLSQDTAPLFQDTARGYITANARCVGTILY